MSYHLVPFGFGKRPPARELARLHACLLPESTVSQLGTRFMERFYYRVLPLNGLIFGAVAYVDDRAAGFVAATPDSAGFMRSALRRWWPRVAWVLGTSVVLAPRSIRPVWEAGRAMRKRRPAQGSRPEGEILSLGVLPGYHELRGDNAPGRRISADLLGYAVGQLEARGVGVIRAMVRADNTPAKLFYSGLGWTLRRTNAPEWTSPTTEFVWPA
jgi:ribosomal protein S18 acetylase RimI-like enzyme